MKVIFILFISIASISGCVRSVDESLSTLGKLGIKLEIGELNECMGNQLMQIQSDIDDSVNFEMLRALVATKNIKVINLNIKKYPLYTCESATVDLETDIDKSICDPATATGKKVNLAETAVNFENGTLNLVTESQMYNKILKQFEINDLSEEDREILTSDLTYVQEDQSEYISFDKIKTFSINFNIEMIEQSYSDKIECGKPLSLEEILENVSTQEE